MFTECITSDNLLGGPHIMLVSLFDHDVNSFIPVSLFVSVFAFVRLSEIFLAIFLEII